MKASTISLVQAGASSAEIRQQLRDQIREQVQAAREQAREAAQQARDAAQQARDAARDANVPVPPGQPEAPQTFTIQPVGMPPFIPTQVVDISLAFFVMVAVIAIGWPLARAFGRRIERRAEPAALPEDLANQLRRIEHSVDAMSLEVERISEAQRYMMRVQGERSTERVGLPPARQA